MLWFLYIVLISACRLYLLCPFNSLLRVGTICWPLDAAKGLFTCGWRIRVFSPFVFTCLSSCFPTFSVSTCSSINPSTIILVFIPWPLAIIYPWGFVFLDVPVFFLYCLAVRCFCLLTHSGNLIHLAFLPGSDIFSFFLSFVFWGFSCPSFQQSSGPVSIPDSSLTYINWISNKTFNLSPSGMILFLFHVRHKIKGATGNLLHLTLFPISTPTTRQPGFPWCSPAHTQMNQEVTVPSSQSLPG